MGGGWRFPLRDFVDNRMLGYIEMTYGDRIPDDEMPICNHCNVSIHIQPPRESGCNHAHYPEACERCARQARYTKTVTAYDIEHITHKGAK